MNIVSVILFSLSVSATFNHLSQKMFIKHHRGNRIRIQSNQLSEFDGLSWIGNNHHGLRNERKTFNVPCTKNVL